MVDEVWTTIKDFPTYEVSTYGRVRSIDRDYVDSLGKHKHKTGQILKPDYEINKYHYVQPMAHLSYKGKGYRLLISRLVAKTFIPIPQNLPQVNHKDENSMNNHVENLEWCTCYYNIHYGGTIQRRAKSRSRAVDVFDMDWNLIDTLPSGVAVSQKYNVSRSTISECCNNNRDSCKGLRFQFHKD